MPVSLIYFSLALKRLWTFLINRYIYGEAKTHKSKNNDKANDLNYKFSILYEHILITKDSVMSMINNYKL
jgi:hypothetical protein